MDATKGMRPRYEYQLQHPPSWSTDSPTPPVARPRDGIEVRREAAENSRENWRTTSLRTSREAARIGVDESQHLYFNSSRGMMRRPASPQHTMSDFAAVEVTSSSENGAGLPLPNTHHARRLQPAAHTPTSARAVIGDTRRRPSSTRHWLSERMRESLWALPPPRQPSPPPAPGPFQPAPLPHPLARSDRDSPIAPKECFMTMPLPEEAPAQVFKASAPASKRRHIHAKPKPPWDPSGPDRQRLKRDQSDLFEAGANMTPARLLKHLNKLKDQLVRTSNRVEKTLGVLQDARNHAQQRMAQLEEVRRDDIHLDGNCMSAEESDLVAAFDGIAFVAHDASNAMKDARASLADLAKRLAESLTDLDEQSAELEVTLWPGRFSGTASSMDLFHVQSSARAASILDDESQIACKRALEVVSLHSAKLETAHLDQELRLRTLLTSPQRKSPARRQHGEQTGMEGFVETVFNALPSQRGTTRDASPAQKHLLRGSYPTDDEIPLSRQESKHLQRWRDQAYGERESSPRSNLGSSAR